MRQHSGAPEPKWNRQITRRIFPPDSKKSSGNETNSHPDATPHKLAPFNFAIPLPLFNNQYECSFLPTSTICNAHNPATRLSLPDSLQKSQGENPAARLYILHSIIKFTGS